MNLMKKVVRTQPTQVWCNCVSFLWWKNIFDSFSWNVFCRFLLKLWRHQRSLSLLHKDGKEFAFLELESTALLEYMWSIHDCESKHKTKSYQFLLCALNENPTTIEWRNY